MDRVLVFTRTKHGADRVVKLLAGNGIAANAIHGNKSQPQRERALAEFKAGEVPILVATDIAARGIDVSGVSHVINFELPNVAEQYVHRIGRTARAGAAGVAIAFCADDERAYLRDIEKLTRQQDRRSRRCRPTSSPRRRGSSRPAVGRRPSVEERLAPRHEDARPPSPARRQRGRFADAVKPMGDSRRRRVARLSDRGLPAGASLLTAPACAAGMSFAANHFYAITHFLTRPPGAATNG